MNLADTPVQPIPGHTLLLLLLQVGLLLALGLSLGRLAQRVGMPAIVGELAAGVLLGPSLLANIAPGVSGWLFPRDAAQMHLLDAIGQIGVLLLVGFTGMHLDLKMVRRYGRRAATVSGAGLLVPLALGIWLGFLLPVELRSPGADTTVFALFVGVAMCVSAIPVIARTLIDMKLIHRNVGQMILVAGSIDDAFGWLMVSVVAAMATTGVEAGRVALSVGYLALLILFAATIGRVVVRAVMRAAHRSGERGRPVAAAVVLIVLSSAGTHAMGLESVLGAFVCGIVISTCKDVEAARLEPLNTTVLWFLAPLFFATAGLRMDLTALADPQIAAWALAVVVVAVVGKFMGAFAGALTGRMNRWEALALGAGLNARGVIEVIIAMVGVRLGLLSTEMYSIVVLVAVLTSVMAPPLLRMAMNRVERTAEEELREHKVLALQGLQAGRKDSP
ncbi:cation:proton antiporter [Streptomyces sp. NA02950]|uniref:cation:proton antiporter n=1 Tax=Streptomyces sp. NA02950 TaxID=2742137 RepID=UPI001591A4D7|nr:cation:proton antiporter [Streptomyces sp. NA02950]QKV90512.1 cation:proton antiporter [Streptomyces sp. NA02950]